MIKSPWSWLPLASGFLVLVLSLAVGVLTVNSRSSLIPSQNVTTKAAQLPASLSLGPATGDYTFSPVTTYPIGIIVDSAGKNIDGVDVVINFDPAKAQIVGDQVLATGLLEQFPLNKVDNKKGQLRFSGLTFNPKPITGIVGTFRIKPLSRGEVTLSFDFVSGATTDSNIAENATAKDILGSVTNGKYNFK